MLEVVLSVGIFVLFAFGIYGGINLIFKIVYQSRMRILETAILAEKLEIARNLPFDSVGIINGSPAGLLPHTTTTIRNGQVFTLITTVRNIDDPFDGLAGGSPNDTSPADYKLVEISAICQTCLQKIPVILSTTVAPKNLEGATSNGSLFIQVFDAQGLPVVGANVSATNTARAPNVVIQDTTDNTGWLKIIDTTTGTQSYYISVTKNGFSRDYSVDAASIGATPIKPPSTVVTQTVTEVSFSIDRVGSMNLHTINSGCSAIANADFNIRSERLLGTNPDVYKYNQNLTTNGSGNYAFASMEWGKYHFSATNTPYDIAGSIPMLPADLAPGAAQDVSLILTSQSPNSLLVKVKDAGTGLPLSDTLVHLTKSGYDESKTTGYGFMRQTDWSGGSGQVTSTDPARYFADDTNVDNNSPAGDLKLKKAGPDYLNSGWLESSTFDLQTQVDFHSLIFQPVTQPPQTGTEPIKFQMAATNTPSSSGWVYLGPDGATSTYYVSTSSLVWSGLDNNRYLRYKVFLSTADTGYTPLLSEVSITYTNNCVPPGQVFFGGLGAGSYTLEVSRNGYITNSGLVDVAGATDAVVNLSPNI